MNNESDRAIHPFTIEVPQAELDDLRRRLELARLPEPLPGDAWDTGVPLAYLKELVEHWRDGYDWRAEEAKLNARPQFRTVIDGQPIHFLHVRSEREDALPLLLTHGWPGSIVEFLDVIDPLTDPDGHGAPGGPAFHVVIPSLPGFGFSSPLAGPGWDVAQIARAWVELMDRLGYRRFVTQGGDIGAAVSPEVARQAPDRVIGVHLNGNAGMPWNVSDEERAQLTDLERDRLARVSAFMNEEFGYISIQSTRPQLIGAALSDSPVGQLAWIIDKFRQWTHPRTTLPDAIIDRDRLLTNVMLYWLTRTAGSAAYVGYALDGSAWGEPPQPSGVPTAVIVFAHDVGIRRYAEAEHTIVRWTDVPDRGGHFAALEEPELLLADLRAFVGALRP
ncbi:epoxide hydrolase family protein [Microlunatus parietis]|uniref:Pimeloyl-ACP methyl ester carboxylesterase n=1 Tax=Microlunatus parietis TaxID=682979 RepID=A0A7Y9IAN4_9ACTN|nr:epoxide hydrolase family protein [Microlunatus parietis]NYE73317.1 pimeloyl-ACP methyl ester carboxylesterase [Microlunatus parietis]